MFPAGRSLLRLGAAAAFASLVSCAPAAPAVRPTTPAPTPTGAATPGLPRAFAAGQLTAKAQGMIEKAILGLDGSKNACPGAYDYFPRGGAQIFYCHLKDRLDYATIEKVSGLSVFTDGPHKSGRLDLAAQSFGRYNPSFVRWLAKAIPGLGNASVRRVVQPVYDKNIKLLARIFYVTYRKLAAKPAYLAGEAKHYRSLVARGRAAGYYERFFHFMSGIYGNVAKTCVAFWIRRTIDGTAKDFFAGLTSLLGLYDAAFLRAAQQVRPASGSYDALVQM